MTNYDGAALRTPFGRAAASRVLFGDSSFPDSFPDPTPT